jgi:hypothetical protein
MLRMHKSAKQRWHPIDWPHADTSHIGTGVAGVKRWLHRTSPTGEVGSGGLLISSSQLSKIASPASRRCASLATTFSCMYVRPKTNLIRATVLSDLDAGTRVVEWVEAEDLGRSPRPGRFEEQRWSETASAWQATSVEWDPRAWLNSDACRKGQSSVSRGPLSAFLPDDEFLFVGSIRKRTSLSFGAISDESPCSWPIGQFALQHQCAGYGMAQALLDGAFFPISPSANHK